jgi:hypothetical protein
VLAITGILLFSCSKDSIPPQLEGMTGTWRYIGYSGGFAGFPFKPVDTINLYLQVDTANRRILVNNNGTLQCSNYTFEKSPDGNYGFLTLQDSIMYTKKFTVSLLHDTLSLYPTDFMDAFASYFKPVNQHFNWCTPAAGGSH